MMYLQNSQAPAITIFERYFLSKRWSDQRRRTFYQILVSILTFITYTSYHVNKRPYNVVKSVLSPSCNVTNATACKPWKPFTGSKEDKSLFGWLDFTFEFTYSISLFVSGYLVDRTNLRLYLSFGMTLTGLSSFAFGMAYYLKIHSLGYFFGMQILAGIVQSTGLPAVTEAIGLWIPYGKTGIMLGVWSCHILLGDIIGNVIGGGLLRDGWGMPFFFSGLMIILNSSLVYTFLIPDPKLVNIVVDDRSTRESSSSESEDILRENSREDILKEDSQGDNSPNDDSPKDDSLKENSPLEESEEEKTIREDSHKPITDGVGLGRAFRTPGVLEYSASVFFAKLVVFTFFFWLPYVIKVLEHVNPSEAAYRASIWPLGGVVGAIIAGILYDVTDSPAIIAFIMLLAGAPTIFVFFTTGLNHLVNSIGIFLAGLFMIGSNMFMTVTVAKRLGTQQQAGVSNTRSIAIMVGILDGFGSLGASIGPLVTGLIQAHEKTWRMASYFLITCTLMASLSLSRQFYNEVKVAIYNHRTKRNSKYDKTLLGSHEGEKLLSSTE